MFHRTENTGRGIDWLYNTGSLELGITGNKKADECSTPRSSTLYTDPEPDVGGFRNYN